MKNKKVLVGLILITLVIGTIITFKTDKIDRGIPLPFFWQDTCPGEYSGIPFSVWSCPPSEPDPTLGPMLCACTMNPIAMLLNILFYSLLTLFILYLIKRIFLSFKKQKS